MTVRHRIANLFGKHSRRVWRSVLGAAWTYPARFVTLPAAMAATGLVDLSAFTAGQLAAGLAKGAAVATLLGLCQLLINEYVVFGAARKIFVRPDHD
jgi:hypothetical protein